MISKWLSLIVLLFFITAHQMGNMTDPYALIGALGSLFAIIGIEVVTHRNDKWKANLETRVKDVEIKVISLSNTDRLKKINMGGLR